MSFDNPIVTRWRKEEEKKYMQSLSKYVLKNASTINQIKHISKSHSNGYVVYAISTNTVGCDIEKIRWDLTIEDLKKQLNFYLDINEQEKVINSPYPQKCAIKAWTRKESYYKVHQTFNIPKVYDIASSDDVVSDGRMKFVSLVVDEDMILTCYTDQETDVEWIRINDLDKKS